MDQVLSVWAANESVDSRVDHLIGFINSRVRHNDGKADEMIDDRSELDLFVLDKKDHFVEG